MVPPRHSVALAVACLAAGIIAAPAFAQNSPRMDKALTELSAQTDRSNTHVAALGDDDGKAHDGMTQGTGGLSAAGALRVALTIDRASADKPVKWTALSCASAQHGAATRNSDCQTRMAGVDYEWARRIVWGENIVWGDTVFYNLPIWNLLADRRNDGSVVGRNIVWGDDIAWADGVAWGGRLVRPHDTLSGATRLGSQHRVG